MGRPRTKCALCSIINKPCVKGDGQSACRECSKKECNCVCLNERELTRLAVSMIEKYVRDRLLTPEDATAVIEQDLIPYLDREDEAAYKRDVLRQYEESHHAKVKILRSTQDAVLSRHENKEYMQQWEELIIKELKTLREREKELEKEKSILEQVGQQDFERLLTKWDSLFKKIDETAEERNVEMTERENIMKFLCLDATRQRRGREPVGYFEQDPEFLERESYLRQQEDVIIEKQNALRQKEEELDHLVLTVRNRFTIH